MNRYRINEGDFILEDFDRAVPFSSFLPGLTGEDGIPMWAFYTNRGQALGSLGINSKSEAIIEFNPACTEYENTALKGFRTFIAADGKVYEPFRYRGDAKRTMTVRKNSLKLEEYSPEYGLNITIDYFILPKEPLGALVRRVKLENKGVRDRSVEVLDGAAKIIPRGISNGQFQQMSNLFKSWTAIGNTDKNAPIFAMRASTEDSAKVDEIKDGYFYACVYEGRLAPFICDADEIFGWDTSLCEPAGFEEKGLDGIPFCKEVVNKVPCAFTPIKAELKAGSAISWTSYLGFAPSAQMLNECLLGYLDEGFSRRKLEEANELAEELTADVRTETSSAAFDKYIEQCYLDNFLRGGYPVLMGDAVLYLYSRKHGDPERDYNYFTIDGGYYSQGNGNFRDVCQNRRNDVFFCPGLKDYNIRYFVSLMQLDGYNPLEIRPATFRVKKGLMGKALSVLQDACDSAVCGSILENSFKPGELFRAIENCGAKLKKNPKELAEELLPLCEEQIEAGALEGYWSDHWDYLMDLIENYVSVWPDKIDELLASDGYRFYDSDMQVRPRSETYVLDGGRVCQYESMKRSAEKAAEEGFVPGATNWKRNEDGSYAEVGFAAKLFTLVLNKFSTLDSYGMGIEMEGGKPGWNDALNGLPAMFASSMPETYELRRLAGFLREHAGKTDLRLPVEVADYYEAVAGLLKKYPMPLAAETEEKGNEGNADFEYWDLCAKAREDYRNTVYKSLSGRMKTIPAGEAAEFLNTVIARLDAGIEKAVKLFDGRIPTYFTFEPTAYDEHVNREEQRIYVSVKGFKAHPLPRFLEGPARYLSMKADSGDRTAADAGKVHMDVLSSGLYDSKLKMFKTSESIEELSLQYGRIRAFTPGWLERESIFLHMEYKYLYALLKNGLYDEIYDALQTAFIPFMDPGVYGRSILENSSFIASSANPDERVHGRGFVARLSGSTTEVISMYIRMFAGDRLFTVGENGLEIRFAPALKGSFFKEDGTAAWTFMGQCRIVYHNASRRSTYGENAARITSMKLLTTQGKVFETEGDTLSGENAVLLREGGIVRIDAALE